jgi:ABC-type Fe3+/spermidine/putrescine transport system ATPase subunit
VADIPLGAGDHVTLMIRPERIVVANGPAGGGFSAEVRHRYFLGSHTEYQLAIGEAVLRAQIAAPLVYAAGTRVSLHIAPEDCRVVRRE